MIKSKVLPQLLVVSLFFMSCVVSSVFSESITLVSSVSIFPTNAIETGAGGIEFCMPVEVLDVSENKEGYIEITTYEKSFVKAPFSLVIRHTNKDNFRGIAIEKYGYTCYIMGFDVINVADGVGVVAGDIVGSIKSNKLYVKVYKNENRVSLKTIRMLFNV